MTEKNIRCQSGLAYSGFIADPKIFGTKFVVVIDVL